MANSRRGFDRCRDGTLRHHGVLVGRARVGGAWVRPVAEIVGVGSVRGCANVHLPVPRAFIRDGTTVPLPHPSQPSPLPPMTLRHWHLAAVAAALLVACQSVAPEHCRARLADSGFPVRRGELSVARAGAELEFKFFSAPELNDRQIVRQDGFVSLQLVGEVYVAGQAPRAIQRELRARYAEHLKDPEVAVVLRSDPGNRVLVAGAVQRPGAVPMTGDLTALDALMLAGGPNLQSANMRHVIVIREHDGNRCGYPLDLGPTLAGGMAQSFELEPRDIVYVPRTEIADLNQFIDQYINNIIPLGFTYTRPLGSGTIGIDTGLVRR